MFSRVKQEEDDPTMGVELSAEITNVLRSTIPKIVDETLTKFQEKRRVAQENDLRLKKVKEEELQEWENREKFLVSRPPEFRGVVDPLVVSDWIMEMENTFEICECGNDRKVIYASFMLRGQALYWWKTVKKSYGKEKIETMLWDEFKELVFSNYSPKSLIDDLEGKYTRVNQEFTSVKKYTIKFIEKARFPHGHDPTMEEMTQRFFKGLSHEIRSRVENSKTFEEAVEQALLFEFEKELSGI